MGPTQQITIKRLLVNPVLFATSSLIVAWAVTRFTPASSSPYSIHTTTALAGVAILVAGLILCLRRIARTSRPLKLSGHQALIAISGFAFTVMFIATTGYVVYHNFLLSAPVEGALSIAAQTADREAAAALLRNPWVWVFTCIAFVGACSIFYYVVFGDLFQKIDAKYNTDM